MCNYGTTILKLYVRAGAWTHQQYSSSNKACPSAQRPVLSTTLAENKNCSLQVWGRLEDPHSALYCCWKGARARCWAHRRCSGLSSAQHDSASACGPTGGAKGRNVGQLVARQAPSSCTSPAQEYVSLKTLARSQ